jgi:hypothetical protein
MKEWILTKVKEQGLAFAFMIVGLMWMNSRLTLVESKLYACYDSKERILLNRQQAQSTSHENQRQITASYIGREKENTKHLPKDSRDSNRGSTSFSGVFAVIWDNRRHNKPHRGNLPI